MTNVAAPVSIAIVVLVLVLLASVKCWRNYLHKNVKYQHKVPNDEESMQSIQLEQSGEQAITVPELVLERASTDTDMQYIAETFFTDKTMNGLVNTSGLTVPLPVKTLRKPRYLVGAMPQKPVLKPIDCTDDIPMLYLNDFRATPFAAAALK